MRNNQLLKSIFFIRIRILHWSERWDVITENNQIKKDKTKSEDGLILKMLDKWLERKGDLQFKINTLKDQLGQKSKELDELR